MSGWMAQKFKEISLYNTVSTYYKYSVVNYIRGLVFIFKYQNDQNMKLK